MLLFAIKEEEDKSINEIFHIFIPNEEQERERSERNILVCWHDIAAAAALDQAELWWDMKRTKTAIESTFFFTSLLSPSSTTYHIPLQLLSSSSSLLLLPNFFSSLSLWFSVYHRHDHHWTGSEIQQWQTGKGSWWRWSYDRQICWLCPKVKLLLLLLLEWEFEWNFSHSLFLWPYSRVVPFLSFLNMLFITPRFLVKFTYFMLSSLLPYPLLRSPPKWSRDVCYFLKSLITSALKWHNRISQKQEEPREAKQ